MGKYFIIIGCFLLSSNFPVLAQTRMSPAQDVVPQGYQLMFEDGFNKPGKPDAMDWLIRKNKKAGGLSLPENAVIEKVDDGSGCLLIKYTYDPGAKPDEQFRGGGVVSTHNFGYGYYETRVKFYGGNMKQAGFHQSFWSMGLTGTNEAEGAGVRDSLVNIDAIPQENRVLEIDGIELESKGNSLDQNYHVYSPVHKSEAPRNGKIEKDLSKWIVMGYEWLPDRVDFYCDGKYFATKKLDGIWKLFVPQNIWFTALPVQWAGGMTIPKPGAAMQIDYFRFYAKKLPLTNRIGNAGFEYGEKGNNYPIAWIVARTGNNDTSSVKIVTDSTLAYNGTRYLTFKNNKAYKAKLKQIVEFIPNGKYTFTAFVKSSGGQSHCAIVINSGVNQQSFSIKATDKWTKISIENIVVNNNEATIEIQSQANSDQWLMVDQVAFYEPKGEDWANLDHYKDANEPADKIIVLNKWIKQYADKNKIIYLDYYSSMVNEQKGMKKELTKDGVHPNKEGYIIMETLVEKAISSALK